MRDRGGGPPVQDAGPPSPWDETGSRGLPENLIPATGRDVKSMDCWGLCQVRRPAAAGRAPRLAGRGTVRSICPR